MKWHYRKRGKSHIEVTVFMNGAKCGELCFRKEEFETIMGIKIEYSSGWSNRIVDSDDCFICEIEYINKDIQN